MFQNLRQGSQLYILHKTMTPYLEMGVVETMPQMPMMGYYQPMMLPLDITVRVNDKVTPYKQLPPSAEVANVVEQTSGEEVCIACSKEAINSEVQILMQKSIDTINSVDMHKQRIEVCKNLLNQLNPDKVREAQQAQEINDLKGQLSAMQAQMAELTEQLRAKNEKGGK